MREAKVFNVKELKKRVEKESWGRTVLFLFFVVKVFERKFEAFFIFMRTQARCPWH